MINSTIRSYKSSLPRLCRERLKLSKKTENNRDTLEPVSRIRYEVKEVVIFPFSLPWMIFYNSPPTLFYYTYFVHFITDRVSQIL